MFQLGFVVGFIFLGTFGKKIRPVLLIKKESSISGKDYLALAIPKAPESI